MHVESGSRLCRRLRRSYISELQSRSKTSDPQRRSRKRRDAAVAVPESSQTPGHADGVSSRKRRLTRRGKVESPKTLGNAGVSDLDLGSRRSRKRRSTRRDEAVAGPESGVCAADSSSSSDYRYKESEMVEETTWIPGPIYSTPSPHAYSESDENSYPTLADCRMPRNPSYKEDELQLAKWKEDMYKEIETTLSGDDKAKVLARVERGCIWANRACGWSGRPCEVCGRFSHDPTSCPYLSDFPPGAVIYDTNAVHLYCGSCHNYQKQSANGACDICNYGLVVEFNVPPHSPNPSPSSSSTQ